MYFEREGLRSLTVIFDSDVRGRHGVGRAEPSLAEEAAEVAALERVGQRGLAGAGVAEQLDLDAAERGARRHQLLHKRVSLLLNNTPRETKGLLGAKKKVTLKKA